jgi:hypothetical protein
MSVFRGEATGIEDAVVGIEDPFREPVVADETLLFVVNDVDASAPSRRITVARQDEAVAWCRRRTAKTPVPNGSGSSGLSKTPKRARLGWKRRASGE